MSHRMPLLVAALLLASGPARAQLRVVATGDFTAIEHRVNAGLGVAGSSGSAFGGALLLHIGSRVELFGSSLSGTLDPDSAQADGFDLARAEARVALLPVSWLALRVGGTRHVETAPFATQRWTTARVGAEARLHFVGGAITSRLSFDLMPVVEATGLERPNRALAAGAGVSWSAGVLAADLSYSLERYDFPESGGVRRREQLGLLTARFGLGVGRRPGR